VFKAPRGTTDILPEERKYWDYIRQNAVRVCELYGYGRLDTPVFEDTGLFARSVGDETDIVTKEMYTFDDRGGNSITLRPEGTASVCRAYIEHGMSRRPRPVRLYYFSSIYRYERPQAGRLREHHQFGCEAIGDGSPSLDAEVIAVAWQFFTGLGLKALTLHLNSIGCKECRPAFTAALKEYYAARVDGLCGDCKIRMAKNPLRLLDCKHTSCRNISDGAPRTVDYLCGDCGEHFNRLKHYLDILAIPYVIDHRLVRGLDYYTRTVFEIQPEAEGAQSTVGGGGRYDDLVSELGGPPTPAIGFGTGIERLIINLKREGVAVPDPPAPAVFVAAATDGAADAALSLANRLRGRGISVRHAPGRSLKAQLKQADGSGARYAAIIGEEEMAAGNVRLRDMTTGEQRAVSADELENLLA
jgi:histidyl-tRNA synthetase